MFDTVQGNQEVDKREERMQEQQVQEDWQGTAMRIVAKPSIPCYKKVPPKSSKQGWVVRILLIWKSTVCCSQTA